METVIRQRSARLGRAHNGSHTDWPDVPLYVYPTADELAAMAMRVVSGEDCSPVSLWAP